jgi:tyrosine-protein kinase
MAVEPTRPLRTDYGRPRSVSDEPVEVRRYVEALRRDWKLIGLIVLAATAVSFGLSLLQADKYRASARIVFEPIDGLFQSQDSGAVTRDLSTLQSLVETPAVLERAARRFSGLSSRALGDKVTASVDANANIIRVAATDGDPKRAAALANAVAGTFIERRRDLERARLQSARAQIRSELARLRASGNSTDVQALNSRISDLGVEIASAGSDLRIGESAYPPPAPYSPRPVRNAAIALFAALFVAMLVVITREQLRPRVGGARELSALLEIPVLARVPWVRARDRRAGAITGMEFDAFQTLQASLRFRAQSSSQTVLLVTSARPGEGKSRVTAGLGVVLAQSGAPTLLISGDLRSPTLHEYFNVAPRAGLGEILARKESGDRQLWRQRIVESIQLVRSNLYFLGSGSKRADVAHLLGGDAIAEFFSELSELPYQYVLVDAPPLIGIVDSRILAQHADRIIVVARPDHLTPDLVLEAREALDLLEVRPLGLVVVGDKAERPSYYAHDGEAFLEPDWSTAPERAERSRWG